MRLSRARIAPPYRPAARDLAHDLRRGLFRALPYLALCGFVLSHSPVDGVTLATFCLGWVPLTLLEGVLSRREPRRRELAIALLGSWVLSAVWVVGCHLQWQYVGSMASGADPVSAFASIHWPTYRLEQGVVIVALIGVVTSSHTAGRLLLRDSGARHVWMVGIPVVQVCLLAWAFGLFELVARGGSRRAVGTFAIAQASLIVSCGLGLVVAFISTTVTDSLELALWPEDEA